MSERSPSPYTRAGKLIGIVRDLSLFCERHQQRDLAGGMTFDEALQIERQLAEAHRWVQQLGPSRAPKARAAERVPADDECF